MSQMHGPPQSRARDTALSPNLVNAAPDVSNEAAVAITAKHFGIAASVSKLPSERNHMFKLVADGRSFVLKISNPSEDPGITNLQTAVLQHIEAMDPEIPVPRVVPTREGAADLRLEIANGPPCAVCLLTFLQGQPLHATPRSDRQLRNLGITLARLGRALRALFHPAAGHMLGWDIKHAGRLKQLVPVIFDSGRRKLAERFMADFLDRVLPQFPKLRAQIVHNDFNAHNILVDTADPDRITGIVDFGDVVHTSLVNDLAIGAAYQLSRAPNPFERAATFIAAYHGITRLESTEIDLLYDLVATRLLMTALITEWRAARHPQNRDYILKNTDLAWDGLERLSRISRAEVGAFIRDCCYRERTP